jgi:hypothetical protein
MIRTVIVIILFLVLLVAFGCKKEKPTVPEEVNPCELAQPTTGDFLIEEQTAPAPPQLRKYTITDTVFNGKNVRFTALQDDAQYTWYIGTEVLHVQSFERYFGSSLSNTDIPITLVTRKTPNKLCFPNDDGYDSITKIMHVSHLPDWVSPDVTYGPIEGNFRVKSEHLPDSFDVKIDITYIGGESYFNITNYDGFGSSCIQQARPSIRNYRQIWVYDGTSSMQCDAFKGYLHVHVGGLIEFNITLFNTNDPNHVSRAYLGRRI